MKQQELVDRIIYTLKTIQSVADLLSIHQEANLREETLQFTGSLLTDLCDEALRLMNQLHLLIQCKGDPQDD